jgi:hypothetical protein
MPDAFALAARFAPQAMALVVAAIFLDSLRYKFTNHPKTQEIFTRLDAWAASLGARGLFARTGLFSQYLIGAAELLASAMLLAGAFYPPASLLLPLGALLGLAVMSGAISFHLFTPLGIDPNKDGGGLFRAACLVWVLCLALVLLYASDLISLGRRAASLLASS